MRSRQQRIQSIYDELEVIWKRLNIPEIETDEFVEQNRGTTNAVIQAVHICISPMTLLTYSSSSYSIKQNSIA